MIVFGMTEEEYTILLDTNYFNDCLNPCKSSLNSLNDNIFFEVIFSYSMPVLIRSRILWSL